MTDDELVDLLVTTADAVSDALASTDRWHLVDGSGHQHHSDLAADAAALDALGRADVDILSEESGYERSDVGVTVVVDPLDGSTNAAQGIPWYAVSLCAVDADGPRASVVRNLASGVHYQAVRGGGATRDGVPISPSGCRSVGDAIVALSALPSRDYGWRQYRTLGAAALDLCAVADGTLDGYVDCGDQAHGVWDYLGAVLVCHEAGAAVADAFDRELSVLDHAARRTPVGAASTELLSELVAARTAP